MEIQKAEEFADHIRALPVLHEQFSGLSTLIRARDEAIIERCKEAVRNITTKKKMSGEASWGWMEARYNAEEALNTISRELEGGA